MGVYCQNWEIHIPVHLPYLYLEVARILEVARVRKTIFLDPLGMISVVRKTSYLPSPFPLEEREKFLRKNWTFLSTGNRDSSSEGVKKLF